MGKARKILILALSLGILAGCALLPLAVSAFRDRHTMGQSHFETTPPIQLQIREEADSVMAKLAMMTRMDSGFEISETLASMTREEAIDRSLAALQTYIDAGLVEDFDPVVHGSWCILATAALDPSLNGIYWQVTVVSGDDNNFAQLDLAIDDESGYLLSVSFASEQPRDAREREKQLSGFADLYFTGLDIAEYAHFAVGDLESAYIGDNACAVRYRFADPVYGELNVDLYVHEYGFYTGFPGR